MHVRRRCSCTATATGACAGQGFPQGGSEITPSGGSESTNSPPAMAILCGRVHNATMPLTAPGCCTRLPPTAGPSLAGGSDCRRQVARQCGAPDLRCCEGFDRGRVGLQATLHPRGAARASLHAARALARLHFRVFASPSIRGWLHSCVSKGGFTRVCLSGWFHSTHHVARAHPGGACTAPAHRTGTCTAHMHIRTCRGTRHGALVCSAPVYCVLPSHVMRCPMHCPCAQASDHAHMPNERISLENLSQACHTYVYVYIYDGRVGPSISHKIQFFSKLTYHDTQPDGCQCRSSHSLLCCHSCSLHTAGRASSCSKASWSACRAGPMTTAGTRVCHAVVCATDFMRIHSCAMQSAHQPFAQLAQHIPR